VSLWGDFKDWLADPKIDPGAAYDYATPWDTAAEQEEALDPYIEDFEAAAEGIQDVAMWEPVYDDDGRLIGWRDPSAEGHWEDAGGGDQVWVEPGLVKDYSSLWEQLDIAKETEIPGIEEWMTAQGYDFYDPMARDEAGTFTDQTMQEMQALIDQLTTGPSAMELDQATAYAERTMGLDPGTYAEIVGGLREASMRPIGEMEGLTDEERAIRERINRNELRGMEERAGRLLDNIMASTGSVSRSYAAADQAISQINDVQLQQQMTIYNDDYMRKKAESDKAMQQYQLAVQNGQMSQAQYLEILQQNKSLAFQGYAVQVNTMMQQNQQYLQMYGADMMAIEANINNIYKAIQMEIGIDEKAISDMEAAYQREIAPFLLQMDIALQQLELAQSQLTGFEDWLAPLASYVSFAVDVIGLAAMAG